MAEVKPDIEFTVSDPPPIAVKQLRTMQNIESYDWNHIVQTRRKSPETIYFTVHKLVKSRNDPREVDLHIIGVLQLTDDNQTRVEARYAGAPIILDVTNNEIIVLLSLLVIFFAAYVEVAGGISFLTGFFIALVFTAYKWANRQIAKRGLGIALRDTLNET